MLSFLVDPVTASAWDLWRCADVVCHELAHQWFGNYVTAASWVSAAHAAPGCLPARPALAAMLAVGYPPIDLAAAGRALAGR